LLLFLAERKSKAKFLGKEKWRGVFWPERKKYEKPQKKIPIARNLS